PGKKGDRGPIPSKVVKMRPVTFREYGPEWLIKGVGDYRGPSVYGEFDQTDMSTFNRGLGAKTNLGPAGNKQFDKVKAQDFNDIPDATQRELYAKYDRAGSSMGNTQIGKVIAHDFHDIPDSTKREDFSKYDRAGASIGNTQFDKNKLQSF